MLIKLLYVKTFKTIIVYISVIISLIVLILKDINLYHKNTNKFIFLNFLPSFNHILVIIILFCYNLNITLSFFSFILFSRFGLEIVLTEKCLYINELLSNIVIENNNTGYYLKGFFNCNELLINNNFILENDLIVIKESLYKFINKKLLLSELYDFFIKSLIKKILYYYIVSFEIQKLYFLMKKLEIKNKK